MQTEKVKVKHFHTFGDGCNTTEYRDIHNRRYFVQGPKQKDLRVYAEYPKPLIAHDDFRDRIALVGIELEVVETFNYSENDKV